MVREISASETRRRLLVLLDEVAETWDEVVITKRGRPVARLVPCAPRRSEKHPLRRKKIWISEDFDEPMAELWESVDG